MFDFNVNIYGKMGLTVVANNREEAERILKDTIDSITVKDIREQISRNNDVKIKSSNVRTNISKKNKNKENER